MKFYIPVLLLFMASSCASQLAINASENQPSVNAKSVLTKGRWLHGSATCKNNTDPAHEVYKHNEQTFIIRQNKCLTYEAPFIYILIGQAKILILDTGALTDNSKFSFQSEITKIIGKETLADKKLLVVHSHGHGDHYQGDASLQKLSNVQIVNPTSSDVHQYFGFAEWPEGQKTIDLGGRKVTILPTPGHQEEAITIYDEQTKWLLTGDTLYPGYIYVKDWQSYRKSIDKLATFANKHEVSAILGAHIEMKNQAGLFYPIGSTYQPNEAQLDLTVQSLKHLNELLKKTDKPTKIVFDDFILEPMSGFQKTISNAARWFSQ